MIFDVIVNHMHSHRYIRTHHITIDYILGKFPGFSKQNQIQIPGSFDSSLNFTCQSLTCYIIMIQEALTQLTIAMFF
jgi:hypothetical protein